MNFPDGLYYSKEHEWLKLEDDGETAVIGITAFAQDQLGDIIYVDLEDEGSEFASDEVFGSVEAVKTVSDLFIPVSGEILAHNGDLEDHPEYVNEDPYGKGWMIRIRMTDPTEIDALMSASVYAEMVG